MKWTDTQINELKAMCFDEVPNARIAEHFGVPTTEVHAKRSQLGITIPKVRAAKSSPAITENPGIDAALPKGLAVFENAGDTCIVLARSGDTALIVRPGNGCAPFVVPMMHRKGDRDWWQGKYFGTLAAAWAYYQSVVLE